MMFEKFFAVELDEGGRNERRRCSDRRATVGEEVRDAVPYPRHVRPNQCKEFVKLLSTGCTRGDDAGESAYRQPRECQQQNLGYPEEIDCSPGQHPHRRAA